MNVVMAVSTRRLLGPKVDALANRRSAIDHGVQRPMRGYSKAML